MKRAAATPRADPSLRRPRALLLAACAIAPACLAPAAATRLRRASRLRGVVADALAASDGVAVRKPKTDTRSYVHTTFSSGLRVMLVQDAEAKNTGFAVAVEAGSLDDPPDFQGLAHFTEHMVFLGSKKYPSEDEFSKVLALHGGQHNAYTSSEETVYFNEISNEGVDRGMDIFSRFFIDPTFAADMVYREIHAVDSEHKKNQPDTQRRLWHLLRSRANPENPVHLFATGDLETLKTEPESHGKSLVKALQDFHHAHYCARRLHLVIVSNATADEQLALAHRHFDDLPAATAESCPPRPTYTDKPLFNKELGNIGRRFVVGTKGSPELWVMLPMPAMKSHYKEMPEAYIWNALGHYGPGGLKALLMKEDLSQSYSYYMENTVAGSIVFITIQLTEKGAGDTDRVLEYLFAYLNLLRSAGVNKQLLDGVQQLRQVSFDYQEKKASEYQVVSSMGGALASYAPEDALTGGVLIDRPDEALTRTLLENMVPSNMNVAFVNPHFNESRATQHEKYYDFGYDEEALAPELIARLEKASGFGLEAPPELTFVPRKVDLVSERAGNDGPELIVQEGSVEGWWLGSAENIQLPKAVVQVKLGFPEAVIDSVEDAVLASMHARIVNTVLEQPTDMIQTCGLTYSLSSHNDGLALSFSGFDEHMSELIGMVLPKVRSPGAEGEAAFEQARRQLVLDLADETKLQPYEHALEAFEVVTVKGRYARSEMLAAARDAERVNPKAYGRFLQELFADGGHLSVLLAGNLGRERSKAVVAAIATGLNVSSSALAAPSTAGSLRVLDPSQPLEVRIPNPIEGDPNSATLVTYQFGVPTSADRVRLAMLGEFIDRPVFEALRTERQLGYVVFGFVAPHASIVEVRILVQGFRETPDVVEGLVEETVRNLTARIAALPESELAARRQNLRTQLTKPPSTLSQFAGMYWDQIWEGTHCFKKRALQLKALDADAEVSSAKPLLDTWRHAVEPQGGALKKIAVKLYGAGAAGRPDADAAPAGPPGAITLATSSAVQARLKGEEYWPHEFVCA